MLRKSFTELGEFAFFAASSIARLVGPAARSREGLRQMHRLGVDSLTVVNLCCFFIGLVLVLQTTVVLARYGAKGQVSAMLAVSFVREIGPVFASIMFAGRVGTGISAEIGSMVVTEQIDAYRAFGADPVALLGAPRILACTVMLPALTAIGCVVGITSGYLVGMLEGTITPQWFLNEVFDNLEALDIVACLVKATFFGLVIGLIATFTGFRVPRATEAIGAATTTTMVRCVIAILVADVVLTKFFLLLEGA
jgi:phospholipid/cholesterol/gamma-HCH transport system permease protein